MDSLTHIALGACIGEAVFSKQLGKKALLLGAVAQSLPDLDVLASLWLSPPANLLFHRGILHSFFFAVPVAIALAFLARRIFRWNQAPLIKLFIFFCLQMWLHDLLDTCNSYGTGLLEPFSHQRFSFNLLFVADPFFSASLLAALLALIILKKQRRARKKWVAAGLLLSGCYLAYAVFNKVSVDKQAVKSLHAAQVPFKSFMATPTVFNTWLWYIVARADSGYYVGYRSVFDRADYQTPFTYYPQNRYLLQPVDTAENVQQLIRFAANGYTVENRNDSLILNVLRFGRIGGWQYPETRFTFHYFLNQTYSNILVVQRGRLGEWNEKTLLSLYRRIKGK